MAYDPAKYKTPTGPSLQCKGWIQEAANLIETILVKGDVKGREFL
jgi:hypothetical protein